MESKLVHNRKHLVSIIGNNSNDANGDKFQIRTIQNCELFTQDVATIGQKNSREYSMCVCVQFDLSAYN